jgi:hypothetical protein
MSCRCMYVDAAWLQDKGLSLIEGTALMKYSTYKQTKVGRSN